MPVEIVNKLGIAVRALPLWVRQAAKDVIESSVAAVIVLDFALPHNVEDAKKEAIGVLGVAVYAAVAAVRRHIPAAVEATRSAVAAVLRGVNSFLGTGE